MLASLVSRRLRRPVARCFALRERSLSVAPLEMAQTGLAAAQAATGLPWYITISGSAVALRVAIIPSALYQMRETRRFLALRPQFAVISSECAKIQSPNERVLALTSRIWAECRRRNVQPLGVVGLPLIQIPLLLGLLLSVRRLLLPDSLHAPALKEGGALWFQDLTVPDQSAVLPVVSLLVLMANLQLSLSAGRPGGVLLGLRNFAQAGAIVSLPFYAELPAGIFLYWCALPCGACPCLLSIAS